MNSLDDNGFVVIRNLYDVNNHTIKHPNLFDYTKEIINNGVFDEQTPFAPAFYKDREMSKVQIKIMPILEKELNIKLYPTYNYFRIYNKNSILKPHIDRGACEVSVTMNIGFDGDYNWAIWIKGKDNKDHSVILAPGDGLVYLGCERPHWREDADERVICQSQVFMHYVQQDKDNEDYIYDIK